MLLKRNKPVLSDNVWSRLSNETQFESPGSEKDWQYVLDRGVLLHRLPWPSPGSATYREVCLLYSHYVAKNMEKPLL